MEQWAKSIITVIVIVMEEEQPRNFPAITIDNEKMAGVWANFAAVSHSEHEFTLDFIRLESNSKSGLVVARVSVSPLFITQLIDALSENWSSYAELAMPKEVFADEPDREKKTDDKPGAEL